MRKSVLFAGAILLILGPAAFALGPDTDPTTATSSSTVTVTIPGLVGVDVESNVTFDFSNMIAATPTWTCAQSGNHWPISINCSSNGSGNVIYDPTNDTAAGTVAPAPVNGTATGGAYAALSPVGEKGVWLALFCSKSTAGQPALSATLGAFSGTPVGFNESNIHIKSSTNPGGQNPSTVGGADTAFVAGGSTISGLIGPNLGVGGTTFGWTRADQVVTMQLANDSNLGSPGTTSHTATLTFTITK